MEYILEVEENVSTGYRWVIETNATVVEDDHIAAPQKFNQEPLIGGPGKRRIVVDSLYDKKKPLEIHMRLVQAWEDPGFAEKEEK